MEISFFLGFGAYSGCSDEYGSTCNCKLIDHAVTTIEVLTIDGIDYRVGTWIADNTKEFNKKTIRADRLLALQQLNHN